MRVLLTMGTPGGHVEGFDEFFLIFGWKHFSSINFVDLHPFCQTFGLASGTFVRNKVGLILVIKSFNSFNFYSILVECPCVATSSINFTLIYIGSNFFSLSLHVQTCCDRTSY